MKNVKDGMKKYFGKDWPKIYAYRLLYMSVFIMAVLTLDFLSKYLVANKVGWLDGEVASDWGIVRWKFIAHYNTTVFSWLRSNPSNATLITLNVLTLIFLMTLPIFFSNKSMLISLAFLIAGTLGNTIDRIAHKFVIDVINLPWFQKGNAGTFNFADLFVVIGSIIALINVIISIWKDSSPKKVNNV